MYAYTFHLPKGQQAFAGPHKPSIVDCLGAAACSVCEMADYVCQARGTTVNTVSSTYQAGDLKFTVKARQVVRTRDIEEVRSPPGTTGPFNKHIEMLL